MDQLHELQAERNARIQLLINSQGDAIAHLEHVVGAILLVLDAKTRSSVGSELSKIETLSPDTMSTVQLFGEAVTKSQRELWREELADIEAQIADLEATGATDNEA